MHVCAHAYVVIFFLRSVEKDVSYRMSPFVPGITVNISCIAAA